MSAITLTKEEQLQAGTVMMMAALDIFKKLPLPRDLCQDELARCTIRALAAATAAMEAEKSRIVASSKAGSYAVIDIEPQEATATAFWLWSHDIDPVKYETHPASRGGTEILAFAQGIAAAWAVNEALILIDDGSLFLSGNGAKLLEPKL